MSAPPETKDPAGDGSHHEKMLISMEARELEEIEYLRSLYEDGNVPGATRGDSHCDESSATIQEQGDRRSS